MGPICTPWSEEAGQHEEGQTVQQRSRQSLSYTRCLLASYLRAMAGRQTFAFGSPFKAGLPGVVIPSLDLCASTATRRNDVFPAGSLDPLRC